MGILLASLRIWKMAAFSTIPFFPQANLWLASRHERSQSACCHRKKLPRQREITTQADARSKDFQSNTFVSWHATLSRGKSRPGQMFVSSFCVPYFPSWRATFTSCSSHFTSQVWPHMSQNSSYQEYKRRPSKNHHHLYETKMAYELWNLFLFSLGLKSKSSS